MLNYNNPGNLVKLRGRDWVVQPSNNKDLLVIKPLGGTEEEITAVYLPLGFSNDKPESTSFPIPDENDIGDVSTSLQLYNAARLSFRNGAGPFRSIAKLSFRPRAYQMVPLIMSLRQETLRLLISDDVGVGKTIEALLIVKELLERKEIDRFAIVCLPHLCDQWQSELKDKFDIEAVVIRSNTQASLDRKIHGDTSVYKYYPYQIISIDYIKSESRRNVFINECPELVIVDEVHSCAKPSGALKNQQQRYSLLYDLSEKENQHLVMLTATPHSGKQQEFQSLLGLLKKDFEFIDLPKASRNQRQMLAKHFVQRKRADVQKWMNEDTIFPERDAGEIDYPLSDEYKRFFSDIQDFASKLVSGEFSSSYKKRIHYWTALALLRGVMSSPAAGIEMLKNRIRKLDISDEILLDEDNPVIEKDFDFFDSSPSHVVGLTSWSEYQIKMMNVFAEVLEKLKGPGKDRKVDYALMITEDWIKEGYNPVIFCRYIETAKYAGEIIKSILLKKFKDIDIQIITSEDPDEVRRERIESMGNFKKRVLICTDCLSEGINLQEYFTAVLHYDLPWNPNRLEQREGRVDRFGQSAKKVKAFLLYGSDNPIDGVLLEVLLRKVREIRKDIGISIPFPEDSKTILDTVLQAVLLNPNRSVEEHFDSGVVQPFFDFGESTDLKEQKIKTTNAIEQAAEREKLSRSIFAQNSIHAEEIEQDLHEVDEALGTPKDVENFVVSSLNNILGSQIDQDSNDKGFTVFTANLDPVLKNTLPIDTKTTKLKVSFYSPTPDGYMYIGRNHLFVEQLCQMLMANAMTESNKKAARSSVIRTKHVKIKTTVILFRVRNVIEEKKRSNQLVAEEMLLWGYRGLAVNEDFISHKDAKSILENVRVTGVMTRQEQASVLNNEIKQIEKLEEHFNLVAHERAEHLVEAHERFSRAVGSSHYSVVEPVLPMDKLGIYILLPDLN